MISKMLKMQMLEDEDDLAYAETEKKARTDSTSDGRPAWMRTLHTTASNWLHLVPQTLSHLRRTVENIKVAGQAVPEPGAHSEKGAGGTAQAHASAQREGSPRDPARKCLGRCPSARSRGDAPPALSPRCPGCCRLARGAGPRQCSGHPGALDGARWVGLLRRRGSAQPSARDPGLAFEPPQDPLFRFFEREVKMGAKLLQDVRQDLADVVQVCEGKKKQTNYLRTLINELVKGASPPGLHAPPCPLSAGHGHTRRHLGATSGACRRGGGAGVGQGREPRGTGRPQVSLVHGKSVKPSDSELVPQSCVTRGCHCGVPGVVVCSRHAPPVTLEG